MFAAAWRSPSKPEVWAVEESSEGAGKVEVAAGGSIWALEEGWDGAEMIGVAARGSPRKSRLGPDGAEDKGTPGT